MSAKSTSDGLQALFIEVLGGRWDGLRMPVKRVFEEYRFQSHKLDEIAAMTPDPVDRDVVLRVVATPPRLETGEPRCLVYLFEEVA